ncbi:MAG: hypothetical protein RDV41_08070, partial [Planctomycetota bacterium]|nr:hypothetical protein [Planctomycetota bacterium]
MMRSGMLVVIALFLAAGSFLWAEDSSAMLNVQGKLTDGSGNALTGPHDMVFRIYDGPAPLGNLEFTESQPGVPVTNGVYNVLVGETTVGGIPLSVFQNPDLWLEIEVETETLSPRSHLSAHAFAFSARLLQGIAPGNAAGEIPISNGTVCTNLNAELLGGQNDAYYLNATSINAGVLDSSYGGTGFDASTLGDGSILYNDLASSWVELPIGAADSVLTVGPTGFPEWLALPPDGGITSLGGQTGTVQTFANDTNVTMTSNADMHSLGWTGQLAVSRGGTGASTLTGMVVGNGAGAFSAVTGTMDYAAYWIDANTIAAEQYLDVTRGGTGAGSFSPGALLVGNASGTLQGILPGASNTVLIGTGATPAFSGTPILESITTTAQGGLICAPYGTNPGETGAVVFVELLANGSNVVGFQAPDAIASDFLWTLPAADGVAGEVLSTNGSGVLSWSSTAPGSAPVGAPYVLMNNDPTLTDERALGVYDGLILADGGANLSVAIGFDYSESPAGDPPYSNFATTFGVNGVLFEGNTADANEGILSPGDPTADRTWNLPNTSGTLTVGSGSVGYAAYWSDTNTLLGEEWLNVSRGGTGAGSFTTNGVLVGNGASTFQVTAAGAAGTVLAGTAGAPAFTNSPTISGNFGVGGNTTLGDAGSDTITFAGSANSSLLPAVTNTYDLGSGTLRWSTLFVTNLDVAGTAPYVLKAGDTMTGALAVAPSGALANGIVVSGGSTPTTAVNGTGIDFGFYGAATNMTTLGIGCYGEAVGAGGNSHVGIKGVASGATSNYGLSGDATGAATTNYGVFGSASGGATNWAGYFSGNVNITGSLTVGGGGPYVLKAGDTMTGTLTFSGTATDITSGTDEHIAFMPNGTGLVGIGTTTPEFLLSLDVDGGILAKGTFASGAVLATTGAGTRLIWSPRRASFRAGYVAGAQWNNANVGDYSTATGFNTTASGDFSVAMGQTTTASGNTSTALGYNTTASLAYATAMGENTTASGTRATAMGSYTTASGGYSTTIGSFLTAGPAADTMVLGAGVDSVNRLVNNTNLSLMIGFNSTIPTLFVGPSAGIGTTGNVGIGLSDPLTKLEVLHKEASVTGVIDVVTIGRDTTGVATPGIGVGIDLETENDAGNSQTAAGIQAWFSDVGSATEDGVLAFGTTLNGSYANHVWIAPNGFVGFGANQPGSRVHALVDDTFPAAITNLLTLEHRTTGAAANGIGAGIRFASEDALGNPE